MGTITLGVEPKTRDMLALKTLDADWFPHVDVLSTVLAETQIAGSLGEGLVPVLDASPLADGGLQIVMPWLEGSSLGSRMEPGRRYDIGAVVGLLTPIARALDALHERELAHHRLSPRSVFLHDGPDGPEVFVLGAGLAPLTAPHLRVSRAEGISDSEREALRYVAPEAMSLEGDEPAADLFALGAIAFELLAGAAPYADQPTLTETLEARRGVAPRLSRVARVPYAPEVEQVVARALSVRRKRHATATAFVLDLARAAGVVDSVRPEGVSAAVSVFLGDEVDGVLESSAHWQITEVNLSAVELAPEERMTSTAPGPRPPSVPMPLVRRKPKRAVTESRRDARRAGTFAAVNSAELDAVPLPSEPPAARPDSGMDHSGVRARRDVLKKLARRLFASG